MNKEELELLMDEALKEAYKAYKINEIPVGCIIINEKKEIIGRGHNTRENTLDILGHAEINAIKDAIKNTNSKILNNTTIIVNLEPCLMCLGAIKEAHIKNIVIANKNDKYSLNERRLRDDFYFENKINFIYGIKENESKTLINKSLKEIRKKI